MRIKQEIISFEEISHYAGEAEKSVILLRHSMRESLQSGNYDPGLTSEGTAYAGSCGALLFAGARDDVGFGASPRKRTKQTAEALMRRGGQAGSGEDIPVFPELADTAMFENPEKLEETLRKGGTAELLRTYYATGHGEGLRDLEPFSKGLFDFLTKTEFGPKNMVLVSHDILIAALLTFLKVRRFDIDDWCGYLQGAALFRSADGEWSAGYAVPDVRTLRKSTLFI